MIMFEQGGECVHINVSVISVGIITDWMELSDATVEADALCYVSLLMVRRRGTHAGIRGGNNDLHTYLH